MIDESIMEKIIPLPDEDEEMEKVQGELEGEGFPITNFKKGGIFYHLCRMLVTIYIELKELARTIVNGCFIKHAEGDWLKIKAADYSKQQKDRCMREWLLHAAMKCSRYMELIEGSPGMKENIQRTSAQG